MDLLELAGGRLGSGAAEPASAAAAAVAACAGPARLKRAPAALDLTAAAGAGSARLKRAPAALGLTEAWRDASDGGAGNAECRRAGAFAGAAVAATPASFITLPACLQCGLCSLVCYPAQN